MSLKYRNIYNTDSDKVEQHFEENKYNVRHSMIFLTQLYAFVILLIINKGITKLIHHQYSVTNFYKIIS